MHRALFWHRALGAKACHPDQRFCRWKLLFYQQPCAKAKEFGEAEFWDSMPVFYGGILYWLLEKQGKLYFLQSSQTKGRGVLLPPLQPGFAKDTAFLSAKAQNSRIRRSRILGIVCRFSPWNVFPPMKPAVWGFGLGLLGGQGFIGAKASLDPLCRAFVAQSFVYTQSFGGQSLSSRPTLLPPLQPWFVKETAFFFAKAQNPRIRRSRILGIVCRFSPWNVFPPMKPAF